MLQRVWNLSDAAGGLRKAVFSECQSDRVLSVWVSGLTPGQRGRALNWVPGPELRHAGVVQQQGRERLLEYEGRGGKQ